MPRTPRPGPRPNRSDLPPAAAPLASRTQGQRLMSGQGYGERSAAAAAQAVAPLPDRSTQAMAVSAPPAGLAEAGSPIGSTPSEADLLTQFLAAAQQTEVPQGGVLEAPTARPDEPLTTGMDIGAGPGSEVMPLTTQGGPDPSVILWARMLPALDLLAARPDSSPQVRQFYRRIRSQIPPDYYERTET